MKKIMIPVFVAGLVGCSSAPTEQEIDAADFGQSMTEEACLPSRHLLSPPEWVSPESVIFEDLKCYRGLEGAVPVARVEATYGYRFAGQVDSKGIIGRYSGMTPFQALSETMVTAPKSFGIAS